MNNRIDQIMKDAVKNGESIGAGCMIFKNGQEIYSRFCGHADKENNIPMQNGAIFRLFSLSKPVTSAAAMILIDRGIISPDDPVSKFIPEFSKLSYVRNEEIVPCDEELKIFHLLTMTSGIPYANNWGVSVCATAKLFDEIIDGQKNGKELTTIEICRKASGIPLMFKPGEKWDYGISADILGGVIEAASGMKFSDFLDKNIFEPLGMNDTGFHVPPEKLNRFTALYSWQDGFLRRDHGNYLGLTDYAKAPEFESGGAGLVSTIEDYSKFAIMLANKGKFKNTRLISKKNFEYMTTPKLNYHQRSGLWSRLAGYNYGCLVRVLENPDIAENNTFKGEFGWDGWTGTFFASDPENNISVLYFTQICGAGTTRQAQLICEEVYKNI